jgi:hypothetical protein
MAKRMANDEHPPAATNLFPEMDASDVGAGLSERGAVDSHRGLEREEPC